MGEFRMPSLGADMKEGTLLGWKVRVGDRVRRGDIIAEVGTDKGDIEVEVFEDGVVKELLVEEGREVPVGEVLALIESEGARPASTPPRVRAAPVARKLAADRGLDLESIQGTGPGGAVTREDVEKAGGERKEKPAPEGMRRAIALAMARSNREIPYYYLDVSIDMKPSLDWLSAQNQELPLEERMLPVAVLLKAVANALVEVPELNGFWLEDRLDVSPHLHIGFAISLRKGGLVLPALHDVNRKGPREIMAALKDLISRARTGKLRSSELTDSTITVTSLGDLGVDTVHGVIYPPQVALVGFGRITDRPWVSEGSLAVRPVLNVSLAADHRASDGRRGARFLDALARHLKEPEKL